MREETKIRLRERKSQPRKSMFRPAKNGKRQMAPVLLLPCGGWHCPYHRFLWQIFCTL